MAEFRVLLQLKPNPLDQLPRLFEVAVIGHADRDLSMTQPQLMYSTAPNRLNGRSGSEKSRRTRASSKPFSRPTRQKG